MKESDLQSKIRKEYRARGGWSCNVQMASEGGVPDLVGFIPITITEADVGKTFPLFVATEVKNPNGKGERRPEQIYQVDKINRKGGVAFFCDCLKQFKELIK